MSDDFDPLRQLRPDRLRSGDSTDPADPAVIAQEKERLMSTIDATRTEPTTTWHPPDIYPRLAYEDERAAIEYLERVFQFTELRALRREHDGNLLAWLSFGDGVVMLGRANHDVHLIHSPAEIGHTTTMLNVNVHDIDAHYAHAVAQGADITMALEDAFYGERRYEATDPEGHRWHFGETFSAIRARGGTAPTEP